MVGDGFRVHGFFPGGRIDKRRMSPFFLMDYNAAIEFPPHGTSVSNQTDSHRIYEPERFGGQIVHYTEAVADGCRPRTGDAFVRIQGVFPDWDNEARRPGRGSVMTGSTPRKYKDWLSGVISLARGEKIAGRSVIAINAWNEWTEGSYLEPDTVYGLGYLAAIRDLFGQ